jgi:hypothetical protein
MFAVSVSKQRDKPRLGCGPTMNDDPTTTAAEFD